jgi:hypothetical protein
MTVNLEAGHRGHVRAGALASGEPVRCTVAHWSGGPETPGAARRGRA